MSVGSVTQGVKLENSKLTLVLGDNLDLGGGGSRNGVGKQRLSKQYLTHCLALQLLILNVTI
ncbi:MAG: hypothetical protein HC836_10720 [Richelia sp. RM2_1_2]|nr:hypothetical protein [Richelia sp. RM2_1_2]